MSLGHPLWMLLFAFFVGSVMLIAGGGFAFIFAGDQLRGAAIAVIGLGAVLLIVALVAAANFNT